MATLLEARLQRLGMRVPIFNKWVQNRQAAGQLLLDHLTGSSPANKSSGLPVTTDPTLGPEEDPRLEDIEGFIEEIKNTFTVYEIENICIATLIKKCSLVKDTNPLVPKDPTHVGSFIPTNRDNVPFLILFEDGLNRGGPRCIS